MGKLRRLIEPVHQFCNAMLGIFTGISPLRQQGAGLAAAQALSQKIMQPAKTADCIFY